MACDMCPVLLELNHPWLWRALIVPCWFVEDSGGHCIHRTNDRKYNLRMPSCWHIHYSTLSCRCTTLVRHQWIFGPWKLLARWFCPIQPGRERIPSHSLKHLSRLLVSCCRRDNVMNSFRSLPAWCRWKLEVLCLTMHCSNHRLRWSCCKGEWLEWSNQWWNMSRLPLFQENFACLYEILGLVQYGLYVRSPSFIYAKCSFLAFITKELHPTDT